MPKGRFDILYDKTLNRDKILRVTDQGVPFIWTPVADVANTGVISMATFGTFSGEIKKQFAVDLVAAGYSGENKYKISNNASQSFLGWDGNDWVAFNGQNAFSGEFNTSEKLTHGVELKLEGSGQGVVGDRFWFQAEYRYPLENVHDFRPNKFGRSQTHNVDWEIVWDMGTNLKHFGDLIAFMGSNIKTLNFQANDTDSWDSPALNQSVSFTQESGIITSLTETRIVDSSKSWNQKEHIDKYIMITSGTAQGNVYKIKDNYTTELILQDIDRLSTDGVTAIDTFDLFGPNKFVRLSSTFKNRFIKIKISAQKTNDGFYEISIVNAGKSLNLDIDFQQVGHSEENKANINVTQSISGSEQRNYRGKPEKVILVTFDHLTEIHRKSIDAMSSYLKESKESFIFIPDRNITTELYSVRFAEDKNRNVPVYQRSSEEWKLIIER